MWIVRLALRRPYTFVVMSILIAILGVGAILTMSTDIFPSIDIPIISVIWTYSGISPDEMEKRIVTNFERYRVGRYFWNKLGMEYTLMWLVATFYFLVHGGGLYSLDHLIGWEF